MSKKRLHRRHILSLIKMEAGCMDCGYKDNAYALDLDHRDPSTKSFCISDGIHKPWGDILKEIAKCDVVCSNCHRIRTHTKGEDDE